MMMLNVSNNKMKTLINNHLIIKIHKMYSQILKIKS